MRTKGWTNLVAALGFCAMPATALAAGGDGHGKSVVPLPSNAQLVGTAQSTEIREFPEQVKTGKKNTSLTAGLVGVGSVDRVYEVGKSYKDTVGFFDQQFDQNGFQRLDKSATQTSTVWSVKAPDGTVANIVVRNTHPTTIESIEAVVAAGALDEQLPNGRGLGTGNMNNDAMKNSGMNHTGGNNGSSGQKDYGNSGSQNR